MDNCWDELSSRKHACDLIPERRKRVTMTMIIIRDSTLQHVLSEGKIEGSRSRGRTMWIGNITEWAGFVYVEAPRQELLAATRCIRPIDGWSLTTTTIVYPLSFR